MGRVRSFARLPSAALAYFESDLKISSCSGNRPSAFFEKINLPSRLTSKTPPLDSMRRGSTPNFFLISAARPEALGR